MEELSKNRVVGIINNTGSGYVLTDNMGVTLPDDFIQGIIPQGISIEEYEANHAVAVRDMNVGTSKKAYRAYKPTSGYIYAVVAGGTIKIGKSKTVSTRLKMYKKAFPNYKLIGMFESDDITEEEKDTLYQFGGKAGSNEWLIYTPDLEEQIETYFTNKKLLTTFRTGTVQVRYMS